jgi:hypothetical protein
MLISLYKLLSNIIKKLFIKFLVKHKLYEYNIIIKNKKLTKY